jgi:hypothetical protein
MSLSNEIYFNSAPGVPDAGKGLQEPIRPSFFIALYLSLAFSLSFSHPLVLSVTLLSSRKELGSLKRKDRVHCTPNIRIHSLSSFPSIDLKSLST